jgi:hypothetical protein
VRQQQKVIVAAETVTGAKQLFAAVKGFRGYGEATYAVI